VTLTHAYVVPGSERVTVDGAALAGDSYVMNYHLGTIRIDAPIADGAVVVVTYRRQPFFFDPVYSIRKVEVSSPERPEVPAERLSEPQAAGETSTGRNLVFGGTKSVSFTLGSNRGTTLDQTLQATIEGELTPTIRVRALLSDNNLPIQPEGNTEELEYLDQVFVEIEGSNAKATLGDFGFSNTVSTFSPFARQLQGISTEAWSRHGRLTLAGATAKGVFRTVKFRGTTGLQGPYELLSAARNTGEVIIAGTERVYVDGAEMTRGQNHDYVIDYDQGTITFTPRVLITRDTEIAVDFEASQERYDRSAVLSAVQTAELPGGIQLDVLYAREGDSKDRPRNITIDDAERTVLRDAGDDPDAAVTGGVVATEPGKGEYVRLVADSTGPERYAFDDSTGDYNVSFVEVGVGQGDYTLGGISNAGRPYYEWVGAGRGNYVVGKALPLPESLEVITARARRTGKHVDVDLEWNASEHDRNLFSPLDDDDNTGDAGRLRLALKRLPAAGFEFGVAGNVSTIEDRFTSFDKARPSYFYRDWNLENDDLVGREVLGEVEGSVARGGSQLVYSFGRLDRDDVDGTKHEGRFEAGTLADRGARIRAFDTRTEQSGAGAQEVRTRRHLTAQGALGVWHITPSVLYGAEEYREDRTAVPDSGQAYERAGVQLSARHTGKLAMKVSAETRDTEDIDPLTNEWRDNRRDRTYSASVASQHFDVVRGEALVTRRIEESRIFGDSRTTDLARLKATVRARRIGVRSDVDYEISQNQTRILERSVILVGSGQGDYNAEGEPVGKGKGDYTLVFSPTTETEPTHSVTLDWRLVWRWEKDADGADWWSWVKRNVSLDQTVRVGEDTSYEPAWKVYLMLPSALQRNGATLRGRTAIRQDWSLLNGVTGTSVTVRYRREDDEENRFEGISEERFSGEHALRVSHSLSRLFTGTAETARAVTRRGGNGLAEGTGSRYEVTSYSWLGGLGLRFSAGSSADLDATFTVQEDDESGARQNLLKLQPRFVWRVGQHLNVFGSYELTQVWDRTDTAVRPVFFASAGDAHRWTLTPNLRVTDMITIVAAYQGRSEKTFSGARVNEHELRLETRAFF
jgi:hypothetical protein